MQLAHSMMSVKLPPMIDTKQSLRDPCILKGDGFTSPSVCFEGSLDDANDTEPDSLDH